MPITERSILLPKGVIHFAESSDDAYLVRSGRIAVRLCPEGAAYGAYGPLLLCESEAGDIVPALAYRDADYQRWRFGFEALEETELSLMEHASTRPLRRGFLARIGVDDVAQQGFEDSLVDRYLDAYVKGVIHIAHAEKDQRQVRQETERLVDAPLRRASRTTSAEASSLGEVVSFCLRDVSVKGIAGAIALAAVAAVSSLLLPLFALACYDSLFPALEVGTAGMLGLAVAVGMIAYAALSAAVMVCQRGIAADARTGMQKRLFRSLFTLPPRIVRKRGSVEVVRDAQAFIRLAGNVADAVVSVGVGIASGLVVAVQMLLLSPALAGAAIAVASLAGVGTYACTATRHEAEDQAGRAARTATGLLYQFLDGIEKVRSTGFEARAINAYTKHTVNRRESAVVASRLSSLDHAVSTGLAGLGLVALCVLAADTSASAGMFVAFSLLIGLLFGAVRQLAMGAARFRKLRLSFTRYRDIVDATSQAVASGKPVERLSGAIDFDDVSFSYDADAGNVLEGVSLHVAPGERLGIAGMSGCGKSTLLRLLIGLEQPDAGCIRFDGCDMHELDLATLRRRMGVVLQDGRLIPGSIYENITLTAPGVGDKAVNRAVRAAGLSRDIAAMPMGLATFVGESGKLLSGGQRQRVLLARALVHDPDVIVLDEATSALDAVTQAEVMASLDQRECTQIIVAHRVDTLMRCDRIVVLDQGRIAQEGTYEELIHQGGLFAQLAGSQG